jgi:hypothetical protein
VMARHPYRAFYDKLTWPFFLAASRTVPWLAYVNGGDCIVQRRDAQGATFALHTRKAS